VKLATRKAVGISQQRRMQLQSARASAPALRDSYPQVTMLHLEMRFEDRDGKTPSPQQHTLYPAARAFFRFACPCADCDGDFDLGPAVATLVGELDDSGRSTASTVSGRLPCEGWHARERPSSRPCAIELHYRLKIAK
jgi:hypothetical protein